MLIILTTLYLTALTYYNGKITIAKVQVLVFVLFCTVLATILTTTLVQQGSLRRLVTYIGYLLVAIILFLNIKSISDAERVLRAAFLSAVAISVLTVIHSLTYPVGLPFGQAYLGQRTVVGLTIPFQRTLGLPNISYGGFGMMLMIATPYYLYKGIKNRSKGILLAVLVVAFAIMISQSRSTWAATSVAIFIIITTYILKRYNRKVKIAYVFGILTPALTLLPSIVEALISIRSGSLSSRIEQYQVALNLLQSNPLTGVGLNNISQYYSEYIIHSGFLRIGAESGIITLLLVTLIWIIPSLFTIKGIFSSSGHTMIRTGVIAGIAAMAIEANISPGFSKAPWILLATGLGIYFVAGSTTQTDS
ncbi:hypothetical protein DJ70_14580 [Halorubrum halodurans]|uniref:O-antigen ligase-related domain-containing protein n=2 Tax=Halorubrum halodurans TaxID=1383851 RepID=A0A256ICJ2_9EURY|nr:hypothetical protein DJ70_14580 [Halorubrum halodurans]